MSVVDRAKKETFVVWAVETLGELVGSVFCAHGRARHVRLFFCCCYTELKNFLTYYRKFSISSANIK